MLHLEREPRVSDIGLASSPTDRDPAAGEAPPNVGKNLRPAANNVGLGKKTTISNGPNARRGVRVHHGPVRKIARRAGHSPSSSLGPARPTQRAKPAGRPRAHSVVYRHVSFMSFVSFPRSKPRPVAPHTNRTRVKKTHKANETHTPRRGHRPGQDRRPAKVDRDRHAIWVKHGEDTTRSLGRPI